MTELYQPYLFDTASISTPVGLERFESSDWQIDDLFSNIPFHIVGSILEPCHGNGAITRPLRDRGYTVITNDIDPRVEADSHFDACDPTLVLDQIDWVITNPPFSLAVPIFLNMIDRARMGVIMQLRITFAEPTIDRDPFFRKHKPRGIIVLQRNSFTGDGASDSATTSWFIWLNGNNYKDEFFRIALNHKRNG